MYKFTWCIVFKYFNLTTSYEGVSPKRLEFPELFKKTSRGSYVFKYISFIHVHVSLHS